MARLFLDPDEEYKVINDNVKIYGAKGDEQIIVKSGAENITIDANVENVDFEGSVSEFKFQQKGNQLMVFDSLGNQIVQIGVQVDGTDIAFADETAQLILDPSTHKMLLGGAVIPQDSPATVEPSGSGSETGGQNNTGTAEEFNMTHNVDTLQGTDGNDLFKGVVDWENPDSTTVQTGDEIYGGKGDDTIGIAVYGQEAISGSLDNHIFLKIDGGEGIDTLKFDVSSERGDAFCGSYWDYNPNDTDLVNVEKIVIYNGSTNYGATIDLSNQTEGFEIRGDDGSDVIIGSAGDDTIYTGAGEDNHVRAGDGNDVIYGGDDGNMIWCDAGNDTFYGGVGFDSVSGDDGDDIIYGKGGDDWLRGNVGNDTIDGGAGNDKIEGGEGTDTLTGGDGLDKFVLDSPFMDVDTIKDFQGGQDALLININMETSSGYYITKNNTGKNPISPYKFGSRCIDNKYFSTSIGSYGTYRFKVKFIGYNANTKSKIATGAFKSGVSDTAFAVKVRGDNKKFIFSGTTIKFSSNAIKILNNNNTVITVNKGLNDTAKTGVLLFYDVDNHKLELYGIKVSDNGDNDTALNTVKMFTIKTIAHVTMASGTLADSDIYVF